jgi:pilus assembly protein Flp/PilA
MVRRLWKDDRGQGLTEYALLIALVSLALIVLLGNYKNALANVFRNAGETLNNNSVINQAS